MGENYIFESFVFLQNLTKMCKID